MSDATLFTNRELSWLQFNRRVLDEARDGRNPLLERVKFLAIASTNLDEFFEIRVAGTMELVDAGLAHGENPDRLHPRAELQAVRAAARDFTRDMHLCWQETLVPELAGAGIRFPAIPSLDPGRRAWCSSTPAPNARCTAWRWSRCRACCRVWSDCPRPPRAPDTTTHSWSTSSRSTSTPCSRV
ncbi:MAG: hypothetical protein HZB39_07545 [Planctomycetes bacterium]|nr:hypothetical protein [Planctomycetota bacterium]